MEFEDGRMAYRMGTAAGFLLSYMIFTTVMFLVFSLPYWKAMGITLAVLLAGAGLRRVLR